ncbi:DUF1349 domain-containing protein [Streptomyces beijiangensis]
MTPTVGELPFELREYGPKAPWKYEAGTLSVRTGPREDRFVPPSGESLDPASDAPRLLGTPPAGDFQLIAHVTVDFTGAFDAGLLYLHVSDREWAKLCLERSPDKPTICTVVTRGHSDDANSWVVEGNSVWLRITRTGKAFAFHASLDGETWTFVRVFALGNAESAQVGFMAQAPVGEGCGVSWTGIEYRGHAPKDLRDGS